MKLIAGFLLCFSALLNGQSFDSGSDGSDGELNVPDFGSLTVQLPSDGILNYTTITLGYRASLYFTKNTANTPVYLLASGDVNLGGYIYVSAPNNSNRPQPGLGGPGGFPGGPGTSNPGDGLGPGGGKGGNEASGSVFRGGGSYASQSTQAASATTRGDIYGNPLLVPLVGGSGGGGSTNGHGGAGGGGAILISSTTKISCNWNSTYAIPNFVALGGNTTSTTGCGSGGAVRLVSPDVSGRANFDLRAGNITWGGYGRARIDSLNPSQFTFQGNSESENYLTQGANMVVFPPNQPFIRISEAAGTTIDPSRVDPVFVLLPVGSNSDQTVELSVTNFGTNVPLRVVVTPDQGEAATYDLTIDNTGGGTSTGSTTVQIPAGTSTRIDAWTR